jgi:hypothetical protein
MRCGPVADGGVFGVRLCACCCETGKYRRLREYIEPLTKRGKWDSIECPAVEGKTSPSFAYLVCLMKGIIMC